MDKNINPQARQECLYRRSANLFIKMLLKDFLETRCVAEGADCRSSYDLITGVSTHFPSINQPIQIEIIGQRFPEPVLFPPHPERYPLDYSGGWWDIGHINHYINLNEPSPSYGLNPRDLIYGAAGVAAGFLPLSPPAAAAISVLHFMGGVAMTMSDFSRAGFVDLGSLAIP